MAFLTSYRAEKVYFEKLRSNIDIAKSYIQRGATDEVMALLQNAVDADGAIMLCYRNLGEVWADLAAQLEKTQKALEDLKTALEEYHDDLNKKIDEINNYLVRLINALDERVTILENESKVKFAYLNHDSVEDVYSIEYNGETADFDTLSAALEYPHLLVLIDNENGNIYYPRSVSEVLIDFHADGVSGTDYVDISVTMSDSDVVTVTEKTVVNYTFGTGFNVSNTNEVTPDLTVLQAKLSAGFGIEIDSSNEISVDTNDVQEKLIAGQNITLTPDATDPTKTVIEALSSASFPYSETSNANTHYAFNDLIVLTSLNGLIDSSGGIGTFSPTLDLKGCNAIAFQDLISPGTKSQTVGTDKLLGYIYYKVLIYIRYRKTASDNFLTLLIPFTIGRMVYANASAQVVTFRPITTQSEEFDLSGIKDCETVELYQYLINATGWIDNGENYSFHSSVSKIDLRCTRYYENA